MAGGRVQSQEDGIRLRSYEPEGHHVCLELGAAVVWVDERDESSAWPKLVGHTLVGAGWPRVGGHIAVASVGVPMLLHAGSTVRADTVAAFRAWAWANGTNNHPSY